MKKKLTDEQRAIRKGDVVHVRRDCGRLELRNVLSDPWQLGHGDWVVKLEGISGGYALDRCTKVEANEATFS